MAYGELYQGPQKAGNGRYVKGSVPANKGLKWDEYMSKESQERAKKGWKNLDLYRHKVRPENTGMPKRKIIAIDDDGRWRCFESIAYACRVIGCQAPNVRRCMKLNGLGTITRKGRLNTEHKYKGLRFYYEDNPLWKNKINKPLKK